MIQRSSEMLIVGIRNEALVDEYSMNGLKNFELNVTLQKNFNKENEKVQQFE